MNASHIATGTITALIATALVYLTHWPLQPLDLQTASAFAGLLVAAAVPLSSSTNPGRWLSKGRSPPWCRSHRRMPATRRSRRMTHKMDGGQICQRHAGARHPTQMPPREPPLDGRIQGRNLQRTGPA
jgi:hypothetical protein